jgi:glycerol-3-phosphate dehydrogenase
MPVTQAVVEVLAGRQQARTALLHLMQRQPKAEALIR